MARRPGLISGLAAPVLGGWTWVHEVQSAGPERPAVLVGSLILMGFSAAKVGDWLLGKTALGRLLDSDEPPPDAPRSFDGPAAPPASPSGLPGPS